MSGSVRAALALRLVARLLMVAGASSLFPIALDACGSKSKGPDGPLVEVVQTSRDLSEHLSRLPDTSFGPLHERGLPVVQVDDRIRYQRFAGLGAALTDSSAWLLETQLPASKRHSVLNSLFTRAGISLTVMRVPVAASDFTAHGRPYIYDGVAPGHADPTLAHFSIAHDESYIIPMLRSAKSISPALQILSTPWSPPAWMKTNDALNNIAGSGRLRHDDYGPLAQYFVRFLQAYQERGVRVAAITPQNEPGHITRYPGLELAPREEATFVVRYLEPALAAAGLHPQLYGLDSSWSRISDARVLLAYPGVARTITGLAWHCYEGNPSAMAAIHSLAPALEQVVSECATGIAPGPTAELLIASIRNWATSVVLWNLALNARGGPVQPPNSGCSHCTAIVTVVARARQVRYTADYYQMGQVSRFVRTGAERIASTHFITYNVTALNHGPDYASAGLDDVTFENPDGSHILVAYNTATRPYRFAVDWNNRAFAYTLPAGATVTFDWPAKHTG